MSALLEPLHAAPASAQVSIIAPVQAAPVLIRLAAPDERAAWDEYVGRHPLGTLFHTFAWRDAVSEAFGHRMFDLLALRGAQIVGLLPVTLIASRLFGRRMVSVPYGVGGGVLADDECVAQALFDEARRIAIDERCTTIELRSERATIAGLPTNENYAGFERELPRSPDDVLNWLPRKARAAARHGHDKFGLTICFGDDRLPAAWRLYTRNMRRLGSLNYPYRFFERLLAHTPGGHWVCLVHRDGRPVTGLVTFLFRDRVLPYFFGATNEARSCSAANFTYYELMRRAVAEGYRVFDFGRSRRDNPGSYDFKRFHGFEPRPLRYQRWTADGRADRNLTPSNPWFASVRRLWTRMPLAVTRRLGGRLSRHLPG
jgi:FemAB-related protein (PEP-CTERM system-associated)